MRLLPFFINNAIIFKTYNLQKTIFISLNIYAVSVFFHYCLDKNMS